ncbi:hypothetical protein ACWDRB_63430 [Nonomuraea sp. NPDC003707]
MRARAFLLRLGAAGALLAGLLAGPAQTASAWSMDWGMDAWPPLFSPSDYTGPCDGGVYHTISATIKTSGPMTVKYVWVDKYGSPWPSPTPFSVVFDTPGTKTVSNGFYVDKSLSEEVALKILEPIVVSSGLVPFNPTCANTGLSAISKERVDEGCESGQSAEFSLKANLSVTDGPATVSYRWYRKSNLTRNQWVSFASSSTSFTSHGPQQQTVSARYGTGVSEYGSFKVELSSPYKGSEQTSFIVTCANSDDL